MADIKGECSGEAKNGTDSSINGLNFDEILAATVRRHPVLYDKSCKDFHERYVKDNAWQAVAREVGLVSGQEAEKQFRLLRDRYQRAKMAIHRRESSGKSHVAIVRVQARLNNMTFMHWLDEHIKPRTRVVSMRPNKNSMAGMVEDHESVSHVEILEGGDCVSEVDSEMDFPTSSVPNTMVPARRKFSPCILQQAKVQKSPTISRFTAGSKRQYLHEDDSKHVQYEPREPIGLIREVDDDRQAMIGPDIHSNITVLRDSAQIFGDFVADQLRQLSRDQAVEARYKISGIFYSLMLNSQGNKGS